MLGQLFVPKLLDVILLLDSLGKAALTIDLHRVVFLFLRFLWEINLQCVSTWSFSPGVKDLKPEAYVVFFFNAKNRNKPKQLAVAGEQQVKPVWWFCKRNK